MADSRTGLSQDLAKLQAVFEAIAQYGPRTKKIAALLGVTEGQLDRVRRNHHERWYAAVRRHQETRDKIKDEFLGKFDVPEQDGVELPDDEPQTVATTAPASAPSSQKVTRSEQDGVITVRSEGTKIKTVQDLLDYIEADLERYEVAQQEATMWEVTMKVETTVGDVTTQEPMTTQNHRVFVKLRLKAGPGTAEIVETMLEAAFRERKAPVVLKLSTKESGVWQVVPVADPHFGKYSWHESTGGPNYDLDLAKDHVRRAAFELIARGNVCYQPSRRTLAFLGDIFHYDNPAGQTTSGTALDRDGRLQRMIDYGMDTVIDLILASAESAPTDVVIIPGNHDETLTWAAQRIVRERFRNDARVTIDNTFTQRKYAAHAGNLLGFTHGDKAKKRLPGLMSYEAKALWGDSEYREIHTGHTHAMKAERLEMVTPMETIDGVLVRVAPVVCPPDEWHANHGFLGALRAMETFFYRKGGGLIGSFTSSPDYGDPSKDVAA